MSYIYYRIYRFYKFWNDSDPSIMATAVLTTALGCNILSIFYLASHLSIINISISFDIWLLIPTIILQFICYKYCNRRMKRKKNAWNDESQSTKDFKGLLVFLYVIGSVIIYFAI